MADAKDDHSDTESFKSAHDDTSIVDAAAEPVEQHFSPEEEAVCAAINASRVQCAQLFQCQH